MKIKEKSDPGPQDSVEEKTEKPITVSKETQDKNKEFKESIGIEEMENRWDYEDKNLTIRDAMDAGALLKDFFEGEGVKLPMRWTPLIALVNRKRVKGPKLTLDSPILDALEAYSGLMSKSFFRDK